MEKTQKEFKIIWAVDPDGDAGLKDVALTAIKALSNEKLASVEPVFLLSTSLDSTPTQTTGAGASLTRAAFSDKFNGLVGVHDLKGLRPLTVLTGTDLSKSRMAMELSKYAGIQGADVIVLATHGRKRIKQWILGNFAESLMRESKIPLFIINPHWNASDHFKNILFPTDFSAVSKVAFLKVVEFAKTWALPITLFHKISLTIATKHPLTAPVNAADTQEFKPILDEQVSKVRSWAVAWVTEAKIRDVNVVVSVDDRWSASVADAVLEEQAKIGGIIALASHYGEISRKITINAPSAVWVLYPELKVQPNLSGKSAA